MFSPSLQLFRKKSIMCWGNDRTTFAVKETTLGPTNVIIHKKKDLDGNKFEYCIKLLWTTYNLMKAIFMAKKTRN